jgi:hypothetical protein
MRYGINIPGVSGTYEVIPGLDCKSHHNHAHYPVQGEPVLLEVKEGNITYEIIAGHVIAATNGSRYTLPEQGFQKYKQAGEDLVMRLKNIMSFVDDKKIPGNVQNTIRRGLGMKRKSSITIDEVAA